jgi:hypothetical protein
MVSIEGSDEHHIVITQEKVRGSHFEPIVIRFNRENLTMEREEGSLREQVWRLLNQHITADAIIRRFPSRKKATIQRYIREHTHEGNGEDTNQSG